MDWNRKRKVIEDDLIGISGKHYGSEESPNCCIGASSTGVEYEDRYILTEL